MSDSAAGTPGPPRDGRSRAPHAPAFRAAERAWILEPPVGQVVGGSYVDGGFTHGMTHRDFTRGGRHGDEGLTIGRRNLEPVFAFLREARQADRPFFVWYAPLLPHVPPERHLRRVRSRTPLRSRRAHAGRAALARRSVAGPGRIEPGERYRSSTDPVAGRWPGTRRPGCRGSTCSTAMRSVHARPSSALASSATCAPSTTRPPACATASPSPDAGSG